MITNYSVPAESLSIHLQATFEKAFARTEQLFNLLSDEAYYLRPIPLRHPINFYEGHLPAFIWNTVFRRTLNKPSFNPAFDQLFERGIDPQDQAAANQLTIKEWPARQQVQDYKHRIHDVLFQFLNTNQLEQQKHPLFKDGYILWLILEHELMHQETLLYMIHQLPHHLKRKPSHYKPTSITSNATPSTMVTIPTGHTVLGTIPGEFPFAWDNELQEQTVQVPAFSIDSLKVSNSDFLAFIQAGGYQNPQYWTPETWQWKTETQREHPHFWKRENNNKNTWLLHDFFEDIPLPLTWPVYVTQAEAQAYATFVDKALPTEAEWHRAAFSDTHNHYPWGNEPPQAKQGNFDFQVWSPTPVDHHLSQPSPFGVHELTGNGWEWTSTPFQPLPGFEASAGYPQYSADFFDGQHYTVKGASPFTDALLLRRPFRNWYYWHYPYMYATFRCVKRGT